jgi:hypothetical protein
MKRKGRKWRKRGRNHSTPQDFIMRPSKQLTCYSVYQYPIAKRSGDPRDLMAEPVETQPWPIWGSASHATSSLACWRSLHIWSTGLKPRPSIALASRRKRNDVNYGSKKRQNGF